MTNFTKQFHTNGAEIRMTDAERSRAYAALRAKMDAQPVPSPFFVHYPQVLRVVGALALVLVIGSGSTAFAAEGTLPGDLLYPVKVGIVEPVQGAFQVSDSAKASWNAEIATKRLAEAQALAAKGTLTPAVSSELAANFNTHASAVTAAAKNISVTDPSTASDITTNFSSSVATRGAAILAAGKTSTVVSSSNASGSLVVAIATDEDISESDTAASTAQPMMTMMKTTAVAPTTNDSQAEQLSLQAHAALANATSTFATLGLPKAELAAAKARAATIANRIVKADAELSIGSSSEAVADYNRALRAIDALPKVPASVQGGTSVNGSRVVPVSTPLLNLR